VGPVWMDNNWCFISFNVFNPRCCPGTVYNFYGEKARIKASGQRGNKRVTRKSIAIFFNIFLEYFYYFIKWVV